MGCTPCGCSADGIKKSQIDVYRTVACTHTVGRDPVAVPEKIFGLTLILDFFDRCHSLVSLPPPQAAVDSLPTGRAVCEAADRLQNDLLYVGRRQYLVAYATRRARWSRPTVVIGRAANCSINSCLTEQIFQIRAEGTPSLLVLSC